MLHLDLLQNRWLILALGGGAVLVLLTALAYLTYWRAGGGHREAGIGPGGVPWIILFLYAVTIVASIVSVVVWTLHPPNW